MKRLKWLDPYKQSFLFFKWGWGGIVGVLFLAFLMTINWKSALMYDCFNNVFVYFPNYLTHEMLGHNLVGKICYALFASTLPQLGRWLHILAGNGVETLLPLLLLIGLLRIEGGRWCIPPILYWLSTTLYGAGEYAADARACSMPLTSSDMITNYKPGEICGDWHHLLEPLNLLPYDQVIATVFIFTGCVLFLLAIYSLWYYWSHADQYTFRHPLPPRLPEGIPNIAPTQQTPPNK